jgi:MFS family permease
MASTSGTGRRGWYYGWNIVTVAVLAAVAANGVPFNCMPLFLHTWSEEMHVPISQILIATFPMMIFMAVSAAVIGSLADRKPARLLLGLGLAGLAALSVVGSFATKVLHIQLLYALLMPIPLVLATSAVANPLVSRWFVKRLGLAIGITSFGVGIAGVVLPPLIVEVMPIIGWRGVWRISAAVAAFVVLPLVLLLIRDRPTEREGLDYVNLPGAAPAAHGHGHGGGKGDLRTIDILKRPAFWFTLAVFLPLGFVYMGAQTNIAALTLSRGFDQKAAGMLLSVFAITHVAATLVMGLLADRFGNKLPLVILAFSAGAAGVAAALGTSLAMLSVAAGLMGFAGGIWTILPAVASAEFGAANTGRVFGLFSLILPVHALSSSVIAKFKEVTGSYTPILLGIAALCFVGGVIALFMRERRGAGPGAHAGTEQAQPPAAEIAAGASL